MASAPVAATKEPIIIELEAGKTYWWCRCGRSAKQPLCDGSHAGTGLEPMKFAPATSMKARFCGCKATKKPPFCDGSHLDLK
ncbi:CDGSH iron-sulfur domain-containing protein [Azospirillum brasilense]|uniref:CDGSH iron-sulfur domain-containing protein n=1 Tax=Azospirillum brasilense TaxID=192 RepID=A0A0P0EIJ6_AZOBR|nr:MULTISPECIES: CDGSH iron-sulfur domain-containing protein [Azospirillum]ALJ35625.1 glutamate synthase [Azospirillum brasilense]MBK3776971.1 CDGSH iron-sulfur domain-containing protein [Azospirillum brasilense]MDW7554879.1 CDGSH iron-sulfur domain-containing protein [Azospirillum brasilense]MDW7594656.1 CDGSH iron-sulfur domain-containing protein [Azospirillum brasilense]MDW7629510.1 CDGSH iron-sulfur domain-containing protein [Azospirillum brasilense]